MVFCTLYDSNYLDKGIVMYHSLCRVSNNFRMYVLAMDDRCYDILVDLNYDRIVPVSLAEFEDEEMKIARSNRSRAEYCWTCSSSFIEYVIKHYDEPMCTYIDSDLYFYDTPQKLLDEMGNKTVQIVEHRFENSIFGRRSQRASGRYCVEFNTFSSSEESMNLLAWWKAQCLAECKVVDLKKHTAGDQGYINDWAKYSFVEILQNLGGGVAPWNTSQYKLVDGDVPVPLLLEKKTGKQFGMVFYHFHNIEYFEKRKVNINVYKGFWHVDDSLIKRVYLPYLKELDEVKNSLKEKYGFYPLIVKHPSLDTGEARGKRAFFENIWYQSIATLYLRMRAKLLNKYQGEKDIICF